MRIPSTEQDETTVGLRFLHRPGASEDAPLVLFVHGRAGTREVMWVFERCVAPSAAILAVEAPAADAIGGFSWWDIESAPSLSEAAALAAVKVAHALSQYEKLFSLHPKRRAAVGFSQGAALLSAAILTGAIQVDGCGLLAGFVVELERPRILGTPRIFAAHGTKDDVIRPERAKRGVEYLRGLGFDVVYVEDDVAHKVGSAGTRALTTWLSGVIGTP